MKILKDNLIDYQNLKEYNSKVDDYAELTDNHKKDMIKN